MRPKAHKRISASVIQKAFPTFRRVNTPEGRRWTLDGKVFYVSIVEFLDSDFVKGAHAPVSPAGLEGPAQILPPQGVGVGVGSGAASAVSELQQVQAKPVGAVS